MGLTIILTVLWYTSVFLVPPHGYAETPLDQIKAELNSRELDIRIAAVEKLRPRKDEKTVDLLIAMVDNRREDCKKFG